MILELLCRHMLELVLLKYANYIRNRRPDRVYHGRRLPCLFQTRVEKMPRKTKHGRVRKRDETKPRNRKGIYDIKCFDCYLAHKKNCVVNVAWCKWSYQGPSKVFDIGIIGTFYGYERWKEPSERHERANLSLRWYREKNGYQISREVNQRSRSSINNACVGPEGVQSTNEVRMAFRWKKVWTRS